MNKLLLSLMNKKSRPTMEDLVKPGASRKVKIVFRASLEDSKKDQDRLLKKAASTPR